MMVREVSIIIPARNEEGTIRSLVEQINSTLKSSSITYEIIVVDDHSDDQTATVVTHLTSIYPIRLHTKQGKIGKGSSLIEALPLTQYEIVCFIDADLQYPPQAIPRMLEKLAVGADIVVGNRTTRYVSYKRSIRSHLFYWLFCRILHGFSYDVRSGLKVFKKDVLRTCAINPNSWAFDLEFLIKARNAGFTIDSVPIAYYDRLYGTSKTRLMASAIKLSFGAIKFALKDEDVVPLGPKDKEADAGFYFKGKKFLHFTALHHSESAFKRLAFSQAIFLFGLLYLFFLGVLVNWHATIVITIAVLTCLYFADLLFNLFLVYRSFSKTPEIQITREEVRALNSAVLPAYTIFCPLYKEWAVLPQFVQSVMRLDYPHDKLQVLLLLEADDRKTIEKVHQFALPAYFETVIVPDSLPKTKPKALNYGLKRATGEYSVIFDAEDVPDPDQLKKALVAFKKTDDKTICIQAKLSFYNPKQNLITKLFTAEYALWFNLVLNGLQSIGAPIPLGGTSNHFSTEDLRALKGWDSFNVTEDCDLGMRLVKRGYKTAIVDSYTHEEANSSIGNWFNQRTRWVKGYMQTYFVHMRRPHDFITNWKEPHVITFQIIVGGKVLSMFINPIMWVITASYFMFRPTLGPFIESFFPTPVLYMAVISLFLGNFLYMYYYMLGCARRNHDELIKYAFLVPIYWLAMSLAAWRAVYEIFFKPHYWAKTKHGFHLQNEKALKQAITMLGGTFVGDSMAIDLSTQKNASNGYSNGHASVGDGYLRHPLVTTNYNDHVHIFASNQVHAYDSQRSWENIEIPMANLNRATIEPFADDPQKA